MTDMVEKVAMAACQEAIRPRQCPCLETGQFTCRDETAGRVARAAIRALMEPTEEMVDAGFEAIKDNGPTRIYQAMLRKARDN